MYNTSLKYRIYPTKSQTTTINSMLEICRNVYNSFLLDRIYQYDVDKTSVSRYDQIKYLSKWKENHPELNNVFSQSLQEVAKRVDLAFASFFRRVKKGEAPGFPRFNLPSENFPSFRWGMKAR